MQLDWMALAAMLGFAVSVSAAVAMLYTFVTTERGTSVRLQRRLAPSMDFPELVQKKDAIAELVAQGLTPLAKLVQATRGNGRIEAGPTR